MYNNKCLIYNNSSKGSRVARALGFMALWGALTKVAAVNALPAAAAPFAYVTNGNGVAVIDTATNMVMATVPVASAIGVAIPLDGKHAYVAGGPGVSVIDTASNTVVATVPVGIGSYAIAVTPDGTRAYLANSTDNILNGKNGTVSVIDTASNAVVATITGVGPYGGGVTPLVSPSAQMGNTPM
jgi:YVTN family beta-propeller protein